MLCLSTLILFHFTSDQALEHLHLHRIVHRDVKDEIGRDLGTQCLYREMGKGTVP